MSPVHFTLAHLALLLGAFLPLVCSTLAKSGTFRKSRKEGGYDNEDPRAWLARQTGWRARANAAQANSFEALPFFYAAVLAALQLGAPQGWLNALALTFVALRGVYIWLYVSNRATLRSLVWTLALITNIAILLIGL